MDTWYLCKKMVSKATELGLSWVNCAKTNRKIEYNGEWIHINDIISQVNLDKEIATGGDTYLCESFIPHFSKVGPVRLVLSRKKDPKTEEERKIVPLVTKRIRC